MALTRELQIQARQNIRKEITKLIDRYLADGVDIYDMKKFYKHPSNFKAFLSDIHYEGRRLFDNADEYDNFTKNLLKDVIMDRIAETEYRNITENSVKTFSDYINESVKFDGVTIDILFDGIDESSDDKELIAKAMNTRDTYITSKNPKYNTYTVTDYTLDISRNNRVTYDVILLASYQLEKMKNNIIKMVTSGLYNQIPDEIEYMGVHIKTHTIIDKVKVSETISTSVNNDQIILLISTLSGYKFEKKYGEHYLWKKLK